MTAFLMLLHESMRLGRQMNKLTLRQLRNGNLLSRIKNKITKRQKYYSRLEKNLETQANMMKNSMKMYFSNMMGLGANSFNPYNPYGNIAAAWNIASSWTKSPIDGVTYDPKQLEALMKGNLFRVKDGENYVFKDGAGKIVDGMTDDKFQVLEKLQSYANQGVQQMQYQCQQYQQNYENNISIWLDYQRQQLDAQQEYEMDMLAEEENDYEMEKTSIEAEMELIKERKETIKQQLGEAAKDSAPKFGLA